jgi:hypothetical protein
MPAALRRRGRLALLLAIVGPQPPVARAAAAAALALTGAPWGARETA